MEKRSLVLDAAHNTSEASFEITEDNILARIKRLQIEENFIRRSLYKSGTYNNGGGNFPNGYVNESDNHKFTINIKESFRNVKTLFEYVKANTSNQDALKSIDFDEFKMTILELEDKIKTLKKYLHIELINLKHSEEVLKQNINENPATIYKKISRHKILHNQIVPSPVKEIINSSFKCLEVQAFQQFMANSENKFGGWNEYYHNIFIKSWNKYFVVDCNIDLETYVRNVLDSDAFHLLLNDLLLKLQGFTKENIISHCHWYIKYTYLKERQRLAIEKWREKKYLIKTKSVVKKEKLVTQKLTNSHKRGSCEAEYAQKSPSIKNWDMHKLDHNCIKTTDEYNTLKSTCQENRSFAYTKPTKQWISRCRNICDRDRKNYNDLANITKLLVPKWRSGLQDT